MNFSEMPWVLRDDDFGYDIQDATAGYFLRRGIFYIRKDYRINVQKLKDLEDGLQSYEELILVAKIQDFLFFCAKAKGCVRIAAQPAFDYKGELYYQVMLRAGGCELFHTKLEEALNNIKVFFPPTPPPKEIPPGAVSVLTRNSFGELTLRRAKNTASLPLQEKNYPKTVLEQYKKSIKELLSEDPSGRICILQGAPGTGKTYMIRGMLESMKNRHVVLLPPESIDLLANPEAMELLTDTAEQEQFPIILVLEDADYCLAPRGEQNVNAISKVLNLGDGILGSLLDIRLICTTNVKLNEFDEAITRPGRLIELINIEALPPEQAKERYRDLGGKFELKEFKSYTIAEIYKLIHEEAQ